VDGSRGSLRPLALGVARGIACGAHMAFFVFLLLSVTFFVIVVLVSCDDE
jgi:hypothetical protein